MRWSPSVRYADCHSKGRASWDTKKDSSRPPGYPEVPVASFSSCMVAWSWKRGQKLVKSCPDCQRETKPHLLQLSLHSYPWERVVTDMFELNGSTYFYYYSRYVEAQKLRSTMSVSVVEMLKSVCLSWCPYKQQWATVCLRRDARVAKS